MSWNADVSKVETDDLCGLDLQATSPCCHRLKRLLCSCSIRARPQFPALLCISDSWLFVEHINKSEVLRMYCTHSNTV